MYSNKLKTKTHRLIQLARTYLFPFFLCSGKYGVVYKGEGVETKEPVALKIMKKKGNKKEDVMREVSVLKKISHPGVLCMVDFMECDSEYLLVTEL